MDEEILNKINRFQKLVENAPKVNRKKGDRYSQANDGLVKAIRTPEEAEKFFREVDAIVEYERKKIDKG